MTKIPIPNDWGGQDWECIQVQWPKSDLWRALIVGFLTSAMRGRYWDEKTGNIKGAQATGWQIFERNIPINPCTGEDASSDDVPPLILAGGEDAPEGDEMPSISWLEIEDGNLYMYFGPCCKILVGSIADAQESAGDGDPDPDPPSGWPCNKASGMAGELVTQIEFGVDALQLISPPYLTAWQAAVPWQTYNLASLAIALDYYIANTVAIDAGRDDPDLDDWMACKWSPMLEDTTGLSTTEFAAMRGAIYGYPSVIMSTFIQLLMDAVEHPSFSFWASQHYWIAATCNCPTGSGPTEPTAAGWYWSAEQSPFVEPIPDDAGWGYPYKLFAAPHDVFGVLFEGVHEGGVMTRLKRSNDIGDIIASYDVMFNLSNSDFLVESTLYAQCGAAAYAELYPSGGPVNLTDGGGLFSTNPAVPSADANEVCIMVLAVTNENGVGGTLTMQSVRWLHNTNSPSHS